MLSIILWMNPAQKSFSLMTVATPHNIFFSLQALLNYIIVNCSLLITQIIRAIEQENINTLLQNDYDPKQ